MTGQMFSIWWREASSGTTPPKGAWMAAWLETMLDRMRIPSSTTAAAVSSHDVSMPRMSMLSHRLFNAEVAENERRGRRGSQGKSLLAIAFSASSLFPLRVLRVERQRHDSGQALGVGRPGDSALGDDGRHVSVGRDVEGGIAHRDAFGGHAPPAVVGHLLGRALLDGNGVAPGTGEVD